MPRSMITQLGGLVRAFREAQGITQDELARRAKPPTNRSVISYLETGIRLPPPSVLTALCKELEIPEGLWASFAVPGVRRQANRHSYLAPNSSGPQIIAVSGIMGSGKTTLARGLAHALSYRYIGENARASTYLQDLRRDPARWAFETQLAFLLGKALSIAEAIDQSVGVVVDRSVEEDSDVFAKYFADHHLIDARAFDSYSTLARYFMEELPAPDILLHCKCSVNIAFQRIAQRDRHDAALHTVEHLQRIAEYYERWLPKCGAATVVTVDSEKWDLRTTQVLLQIAREIETIYEVELRPDIQPDLFSSEPEVLQGDHATRRPSNQQVLEVERQATRTRWAHSPRDSLDLGPLPYPSAYIAAPFTSVATLENRDSGGLFPKSGPHGRLPRGGLRQALLDLEKVLKEHGITSLIPHRDVNAWGTRILSASDVTKLCTTHVTRCDLFVGILGSSHGSHYEFGIARGLSRPSIVVHCDELEESFIASGTQSDGHNVLSIACKQISEIAERFRAADVRDFLSRLN